MAPALRFEVVAQIPAELYERVSSFAGASLYHTRPWHDLLYRACGWKVEALVGFDGQDPVCLLPFVTKRRLSLSRIRVALPLSHHVGFAHDAKRLPEGITSADGWLHLVPGGLEVHDKLNLPEAQPMYMNDTTYLKLDCFTSEDEILNSFHKKSVGYPISRAEKSGVEVVRENDDPRLDDFYGLVAETRRRQGSPLYPARFFHLMRDLLSPSGAFALYMAYHAGIPISGAIFLRFGQETIYGYSASVSDRDVKKMGANELLMWHAIRDAYARGAKGLDMGASSVTLPGLRWYKEKWGGASRPLPYSLVARTARPRTIKRDSLSVRLASKILQSAPMGVFRRLSPCLLKAVA